MKVYCFTCEQRLPVSLDLAWDFFSSPKNLKEITPKFLDFKILDDFKEEKMYAGQIINYIVKPLFGIPVRWTTEITHVVEKRYFVDNQVFGPYALWHHKHFFKEIEGGVLMTDVVHYAIPYGLVGEIAHKLVVKKKITEIFEYRKKVLQQKFGYL
jgi:ligand-binding SRPBCC domain-containing protein